MTAYFISSFEINYKTGEVIFEISGQLKPFLMELKKNFTSFDLLKQLEKQFETLKQQYQKAQTLVIDRLIADDTHFQTAYEGVMNQFDTASLFSRSVRQFSTPRAAYQDYTALRSLMNVYIEQHFPTEFDDLSAFVSDIAAAKKEIEGLKK